MACGGCTQRRQDLGAAAKAAVQGDLETVKVKVTNVGRTLSQDAATLTRAAGQRLAAAHSRLKR